MTSLLVKNVKYNKRTLLVNESERDEGTLQFERLKSERGEGQGKNLARSEIYLTVRKWHKEN